MSGGRMEGLAWKHTLSYVKCIDSENLLYDAGSSERCSVTT